MMLKGSRTSYGRVIQAHVESSFLRDFREHLQMTTCLP